MKARSRARWERAESGALMAGGSTATMDSDGGGVAGSRRTNHHPADKASATPNAMMPASAGKRQRREGAAAAGGAAIKLRANSAAEACRSAGTLASDLSMAAASPSGTVSRMTRSGVGRAVISRATMACALTPEKRWLSGEHLVHHGTQ